MASNCLGSCETIVATFCGPSGGRGHKLHQASRDTSADSFQQTAEDCHLLPRICSAIIVRMGQCEPSRSLKNSLHVMPPFADPNARSPSPVPCVEGSGKQ